ncbi:CcdB family protein [Hydrogenimonas sp.]
MAQFDVYENRNPKSRKQVPFFLNIQNDLHEGLATRIVVPLVKDLEPITHLNPVFTVNGKDVVMVTQEMATVPMELCKMKVASLANKRDEIVAAIDFLVTGF